MLSKPLSISWNSVKFLYSQLVLPIDQSDFPESSRRQRRPIGIWAAVLPSFTRYPRQPSESYAGMTGLAFQVIHLDLGDQRQSLCPYVCSRTMDYGLCTYTGAQEPVRRNEALKKMRVQRDQLLSNRLVWGQSFSCWQYLANTSSLQNHAIHAKAEPIHTHTYIQ